MLTRPVVASSIDVDRRSPLDFARRVLIAALLLGGISAGAAPAKTLHVAPGGRDSAPGTIDAPLATVAEAVRQLDAAGEGGEVVLAAGRYTDFVQVRQPEQFEGELPRITVRSAEGAAVIFDGSRSLAEAEPVDGAPGVYVIQGQFDPRRPPALWEEDTRQRYRDVADMAAVKRFAGTYFVIDQDRLAFHTTDNRSPEQVNARVSQHHRNGIQVTRDNVTIRGIRFENYLGSRWAAGADMRANNGIVEDCHAFNCYRGWTVGGLGLGNNNTIRNCTAVDVGTGVRTTGTNTTIEGCRFRRIRDAFMVANARSQDDAGFHLYDPGHGAIVRNNVFIGFDLGVSIKCKSGREVIEHNTLIGDGTFAGVFFHDWDAEDVVRYNIMAGYDWPVAFPAGGFKAGINGAVYDKNLVWSEGDLAGHRDTLDQLSRHSAGSDNQLARPMFVAPEAHDYRLRPNSPAVRLAEGGDPAGALPVANDADVASRQPTLAVTPQPPMNALAAWGAKWFEQDSWNGGDERMVEQLQEHPQSPILVTAHRDVTFHLDASGVSPDTSEIEYRVDEGDPTRVAFTDTLHLELPNEPGPHTVSMRVHDGAGQWSEPTEVSITLWQSMPALVGPPEVRTGKYGLVAHFRTNRPVAASVRLQLAKDATRPETAEPAPQVTRTWDIEAGGDYIEKWYRPLTEHTLAVSGEDLTPGETYRVWLVLEDPAGQIATIDGGTHQLQGDPRTWHVTTDGKNAWGRGSLDAPLGTLQAALDRALPGDTVRLAPGIYPEPAQLDHGGVEGIPITIEAEKLDTVYLDSGKRHEVLLRLNNAPHVTIRNLNVRWFTVYGIAVLQSPHVTIEYCRFLNHYWSEWPEGTGILIKQSPHATIRGCTLARLTRGFIVYDSPHCRIIHNSVTQTMLAALFLIRSDEGATITSNAFCYAGNEMVEFLTVDEAPLSSSARIDYNNYGTDLREQAMAAEGAPKENIKPNHEYLSGAAKAVIKMNGQRYFGLGTWQKASGVDQNSIFAAPRWVDPWGNNWGLEPDSPMRGAGESGTDIGATGFRSAE